MILSSSFVFLWYKCGIRPYLNFSTNRVMKNQENDADTKMNLSIVQYYVLQFLFSMIWNDMIGQFYDWPMHGLWENLALGERNN